MRAFTTWFSICLLAGALFSCGAPQAEEAPPHRIADFFIRYLAAEQQLKAYASFYEGDSLPTATPLAMAGGVQFIGNPMEKRTLPEFGIRYTATRTGNYRDQFGFTFTDDTGHLEEYVLSMTPVDSFAFQAAPSKSRGATLLVENGALKAGETLILFFSTPDNKAHTIEFAGPTTAAGYPLTPDQLMELPAGPLQLYLVKKMAAVEESPEATVVKAMEYYTRAIDIVLEP